MIGSHAIGETSYRPIQGCTRCCKIMTLDVYSSEYEQRLAQIGTLLHIDSGPLGELDRLHREGLRLLDRTRPQLQGCRCQDGWTQVR